MTAADEYERVLEAHEEHEEIREVEGWHRCQCGDTYYGSHRVHLAQALAADPGVRAAEKREALAVAWGEGHYVGYAESQEEEGYAVPDDIDFTNPYDRQEPTGG